MEIKVGMVTEAFTLLGELGRGGMGTVYLAEDHKLGKRCAVKVLHPSLTQDETMRARFRNEARAAAAIDHPAIVKTYAIDELPGGVLCCRMEYVEGPTLTEFCKRRQEPLSPALILEIIGPICEAFDLLHVLRIVHRDLKPDNVLIAQRGGKVCPRVLDFGIAKHTDEPGMTRPGVAPGTAAYMAPEQAKGGAVDRSCDVYSLGVMIYWMATGGYLPYEVAEAVMYYHQVTEPPVDPRRRFSGVSDLAAGVILSAIHPEAARRPKSMGALALMFARCVEGDGIHPDGTAILRGCAPGVLVVGNLDETFRSPGAQAVTRGAQPQAWKYEYGPPLGRGGMAEVVRATLRGAKGFAVPRAIKLILPEFAQTPEFVKMFHEEARIAALLDHRNIIRVHDHDTDPSNRLYLAMEFVDGVDLQKLYRSGPVPLSVTVFVLSEVLEALDYAHELPPTSPLASPDEIAARGDARGLVHRDVSHHNVLISWLGDVKLSDFGIAKLRTATSAEGSRLVKGKAAYMSPEQALASNKLDGRSDLWAIGVMLWELLTGHILFNQDSFAATIAAVLFDDIPRPCVVTRGIPADLDAITMRLLERDLNRRFQTAREVIAALRGCAAASHDGRAELRALLVERFPDRAPPRSPAPHASGRAPSHPRGDESSGRSPQAVAPSVLGSDVPPWLRSASSEPLSTTGHATGQSSPGQVRPPRSRYWTGIIAVGTALAAFVLVAVLMRSTIRRPASGVAEDLANRRPERAQAPLSGATAAPLVAPVPSTAPHAPAPPRPPNVDTRVSSAPLHERASDPEKAGSAATAVRGSQQQMHAAAAAKPMPEPGDEASRSPGRPTIAEPGKVAQPQRGELVIIVKPWAMVSINGRPMGQTPYRRRLPVGRYRVRLVNDTAEKDETMAVTVLRDQTTSIERAWVAR